MALVTCGDADVIRGRIHLCLRGVWWAELVLDTATVPSGQVTLEAEGGLSLVGTIMPRYTGVDNDTVYARIVGGAGGLYKQVSGAFRQAQFRDPLDTITRTTGETLSGDVSSDLLGRSLPSYTLGKHSAHRALEDLADLASRAVGDGVNWRFLGDGSLWIGVESWPTATLPKTAEVSVTHPAERRTVLAIETPALLPGVDLEDVGRVRAVDHWIEDGLRTWVWL